jgi:DnaJ-class molecular chaperone
VAKDCGEQELKSAYKKQCLRWHPDKNEDKEGSKHMFQKVCEAYAVLSSPDRRRLYDETGQTGDLDEEGFEDFFFNMANF